LINNVLRAEGAGVVCLFIVTSSTYLNNLNENSFNEEAEEEKKMLTLNSDSNFFSYK
jgi:hypothetical protein